MRGLSSAGDLRRVGLPPAARRGTGQDGTSEQGDSGAQSGVEDGEAYR